VATTTAIVVLTLAAGCSSHGHAATTSAASAAATHESVRPGQRLGVYAIAYLQSNSPTAPFSMTITGAEGYGAPTTLIVGRTAQMTLRFFPLAYPVWVATRAERVTARAGDGRVAFATAGCPPVAGCSSLPVYAPTAFPIAPAPRPGLETDGGFAFRFDTRAIEPGSYAFTLPLRYASNPARPAALDAADVVHVRVDVSASLPRGRACTADDLRRPAATSTAPHRLANIVVLQQGGIRLDPPPANAQPRVSGSDAASRLEGTRAPNGGGRDSIVLALYSPTFPRSAGPHGTEVPELHARLAWVLYSQQVATVPDPGPPNPGTTKPRALPPCSFLNGLSAIDAMTGADLDSSGYSPGEPDFVRI
jgi:hypothetical protein